MFPRGDKIETENRQMGRGIDCIALYERPGKYWHYFQVGQEGYRRLMWGSLLKLSNEKQYIKQRKWGTEIS